ncbi:hypothetical protein BXZ70DRAFT_739278 [Cristinia sonorae]|uniref:F-box domain-containing protein n=1 Tax=Cristinia sonorae TaxID=1940300 RepID=A0A8K0XS96_9AGAR|nr:hypothetical protein BXZ70DRAFT_739278 [Cristinia sonorae]
MTIISTSPFLPLELLFMIIDQVRDDKATLASCTLVSRSWLAPASKHLFWEIDIRGQEQLLHFCSFVSSAQFLSRFVKKLVLRSYDHAEEETLEFDVFTLAEILDNLPRVDELCILGLSILPIDPRRNVDLIHFIPRSMKTVVFGDIIFDASIYEFLQEAILAPSLESLMLLDCPYFTCPGLLDLENLPPLLDFSVENLTLNADGCVVDLIRNSATPQALTTLQCMPYEECSNDAVQELLDVSPELRDLRFVRYHADGPETCGLPMASFDLSRNAQLRTVHLEAQLVRGFHPIHFATLYLAPWLQTLSTVPNTVQEIYFDFGFPPSPEVMPGAGYLYDKVVISQEAAAQFGVSWSQLDVILDRFKFPSLTKVEFSAATLKGVSGDPWEGTSDHICECMPRMSERKVLMFCINHMEE